jgi:hypothetical protein
MSLRSLEEVLIMASMVKVVLKTPTLKSSGQEFLVHTALKADLRWCWESA